LSIEDIKRNPSLAKLLVTAAKKIKVLRDKESLSDTAPV
jgi:hypothetical protein